MALETLEVITEPFTCFVGVVGETFPTLSAEESTFVAGVGAGKEWIKVGTLGTKSYSEAGVTVTHTQTIAQFVPAGSTVARKAWRTDESLEIAFELADLTPKQYALIMDNATVTKVTGASGEEKFPMKRGFTAHAYALLLRGPSSLKEGTNAQYEVPVCYQGANPAPKLAAKGGPAFLALQFIAIEGENNKFAELKVFKGS